MLSLAAELLDWLTLGLIGARAEGKCGNVARGAGMCFRSPFLQSNIEELHQGAILSVAVLTAMEEKSVWILKPRGHKHCK